MTFQHGSVGPVSNRRKRTATPISARSAAELDRDDVALISRRQRLSRRRRRRAATVFHDRPSLRRPPRCQRALISIGGVTFRRARARTVVRTTRRRTGRMRWRPARPTPLFLLNVADRGRSGAASTQRHKPSHPLRDRALFKNQRPRKSEGRLWRVPAVPVPSARSRSRGRERRHRCPPLALPNPIASTTSLVGRCQRLSRRRRRRAATVVQDRPSQKRPPHCQSAFIPIGGLTCRRARAGAVVPTTRGRTVHVRRRPARASSLLLLNAADRDGSGAASTHRRKPSNPLRDWALVTNQRPVKREGSLLRVPSVPIPSPPSGVGGRGRPCRSPPAMTADLTEAALLVTTRRRLLPCWGSPWLVVVIA